MLKSVFASGSCRLYYPLMSLSDKIDLVHYIGNERSSYYDRSISYIFDTKSHLQFLQILSGKIPIPSSVVLHNLFTMFCARHADCNVYNINIKLKKFERLSRSISSCTHFIFEICTVKIGKSLGFYTQLQNDP